MRAVANPFRRFEWMSFDCYGTLIDWERGIRDHLVSWAAHNRMPMNDVIARFGRTETAVQQEEPKMPYPEVLAEVLRRLGEAREDEAIAFGESVGSWPAFPDSQEALSRLKQRFRLAILSNVDRQSFSLSNERLGVEFDVVVTAEDVGSYKPDPLNFERLFEKLELEDRSQLLHVAQSLYHDHEPALKLGLQTVWINRPSAGATPPPLSAVQPTWAFPSLTAFVGAVFANG
jgi:2-haloalkanoic acid dehalogenase type II